MKVLLTSTGLSTAAIRDCFLGLLERPVSRVRALFVPTAAVDADAILVLPKCLHDLLDCGIPKENIVVDDLHKGKTAQELAAFDVVYLCGGSPEVLRTRMVEQGFDRALTAYAQEGGIVLGVSAGAMVLGGNAPDSLHLTDAVVQVHCAQGDERLELRAGAAVHLSNKQAVLLTGHNEGTLLF